MNTLDALLLGRVPECQESCCLCNCGSANTTSLLAQRYTYLSFF